MQGVILSAGRVQSLILGDDGLRYTFTPLDWQNDDISPAFGIRVDFEVQDSRAVSVYSIPGAPPAPISAETPTLPVVTDGYPNQSTQSPPAHPTMAGALPTQTSPVPQQPPQPPTKSGFGRKWWYWALSGGAVLIVAGVIGAIALGIFPMSDSPGGTETGAFETVPVAGRIAFVSDRDGNNEIYVMNADGSGVRRLTDNQANDLAPSWSPDGQRITFVSDREIYVMNANGSDVRRLTNDPAGDWGPDWSPDGQRITFVSDRDGNNEIYVMNADGSGVRRLTDDPADDLNPIWSPDGRRIAFVSDRDGNNEIYVMNADGSGVRRLTNDPLDDWWPDWSPDGQRIAFVSGRTGDWNIYVMNTDGSDVRYLTDDLASDSQPSWSPDGRRIAFVSDRDGNRQIYLMNADGSSQIRLTPNEASNRYPSWTATSVIMLPDAQTPELTAPPPSTPTSASTFQPFKLEWQVSTTSVQAGDAFTLSVRMYDIQQPVEHLGISISFPALTEPGGTRERHSSSIADVEAVSYTSILSYVTFHQPGATIYHRESNGQFPAQYLLVESDDPLLSITGGPSWPISEGRTLKLRITPKREGEFPIQIRGWLCVYEYTDCSRQPELGSSEDQQGWVVAEAYVSIGAPPASTQPPGPTPASRERHITPVADREVADDTAKGSRQANPTPEPGQESNPSVAVTPERRPPASPTPKTPIPVASPSGGQLTLFSQPEFYLDWYMSAGDNFALKSTDVEIVDSFTIIVQMFHPWKGGEHGGVSVSFPSLTEPGGSKEFYSSPVADIEALDYTSGLSRVTFHQPGATIYHRDDNRQFPAEYLLVESDDPTWSRTDDRTLRLRITPKRVGEFPIQIRGWLCMNEYTDCYRRPGSGTTEDQQGYVVYRIEPEIAGLSYDFDEDPNTTPSVSSFDAASVLARFSTPDPVEGEARANAAGRIIALYRAGDADINRLLDMLHTMAPEISESEARTDATDRIDALYKSGDADINRVLDLLHIMAPELSIEERRRAWDRLEQLSMDDEWDELEAANAAFYLRAIITGDEPNPEERIQAAQEIVALYEAGELDPETALDLMNTIAPGLSINERRQAATVLARLSTDDDWDDADRMEAASEVFRLVTGVPLNAQERIGAAVDLADIGVRIFGAEGHFDDQDVDAVAQIIKQSMAGELTNESLRDILESDN